LEPPAIEVPEQIENLETGLMQDVLQLEAEHAVQSERLRAKEGERFAPLAVPLIFTNHRRSLCRRLEGPGLTDGEAVLRPRIADSVAGLNPPAAVAGNPASHWTC
jgi:hypothetical protein